MSKRKINSNMKRSLARNGLAIQRRNARKNLTRAKAERMIAAANTVEAILSDSRVTNHQNSHVLTKAYYKCLLLGTLATMPGVSPVLNAAPKKARRAPAPKAAGNAAPKKPRVRKVTVEA